MHLIPLFFLLLSSFLHELHLSMSTISYNDAENRVEVQQRMFYDDLEKTLRQQLNNEKFDILNPQSKVNLDSVLIEYMNANIEFQINSESLELELLEYEFTDDAIVIYCYSNDVSYPEKVRLHSSLLFELFEDQTNVVSIKVGNKKKSGKFSLGSKALEVEYSTD